MLHVFSCSRLVSLCLVVCKFLNYLSDIRRNQTNPVDKMSHAAAMSHGDKLTAKLRHGFEWVKPDATISVDLSLQDPNTAFFLEFLYYT